MTARSIFEVATGATFKARRTFQPVRRNSYNVGEREERFYRPIAKNEIFARMLAAKSYNRAHKKAGKRNGPLGHVGIEVLEALYAMVCRRTGRLDPAIATIAERVKRAPSAVCKALAALKDHGFLDWIRRTEPVDNPGRGPQVRQVSNAYRLDLPAKARAFVQRIRGKAPQPVDDADRRAADAAETERMLRSQPHREEMAMRFNDPRLAASFARLGLAVDEANAVPPSGENP
ncbi:MAG TPA: replication protein A [Sphingomonas sp.]|jgi:hypothetical protein|uniref:replication protein A n=1 Tax=Sphingomonas sp. TaxID=28214 RepID=UPI002ED9B62F